MGNKQSTKRKYNDNTSSSSSLSSISSLIPTITIAIPPLDFPLQIEAAPTPRPKNSSLFCNITPELFIKFCKYLHVDDLFALSQVCYRFQLLLCSKDSEMTQGIWRRARLVWLPEIALAPPSDLCEKTYIELCLYERGCQSYWTGEKLPVQEISPVLRNHPMFNDRLYWFPQFEQKVSEWKRIGTVKGRRQWEIRQRIKFIEIERDLILRERKSAEQAGLVEHPALMCYDQRDAQLRFCDEYFRQWLVYDQQQKLPKGEKDEKREVQQKHQFELIKKQQKIIIQKQQIIKQMTMNNSKIVTNINTVNHINNLNSLNNIPTQTIVA
ncbi:1185_t:CDS:2 [Ambispora gerdemannii]|uniref:1185_t:CDS:1 n=1 Tax=Ambispora gerdemannii TaxID=144530 RepID=A0A9N9FMZ6_9GLOM|nr:1185_t:CDS:2 [Ambispora gerdemannii]